MEFKFQQWQPCISCADEQGTVIYSFTKIVTAGKSETEMDAKKKEKEKEKDREVVVYEKDLDMTSATRGVWLVKVPKYISSRWDKCPGNMEAGRLKISK